MRAALSRALAALGCETATARDGEEMLRHVGETVENARSVPAPRFELVIMDLVLPRTDGVDLLRQLPHVFVQVPPIIVVGSLPDADAIAEVLDLGACDYVPKPFDLDVLLYKVCTLLGEPARAPFHWAPLRGRPAIGVDGHAGIATALSETGLVADLPVAAQLHRGQSVLLESEYFDKFLGLPRLCRGRVANVTPIGGRRIVELAFVALPEPDLHRIRRFTVRH